MIILITGASRGLGFQLTKLAAERGHEVLACVREAAEPSRTLRALKALYPDLIRIERMDVTQEGEAEQLADKLREEGVKLDGVVNNAGVLLGREHGITKLPMESLKISFEVNLFGPMNVIKHMSGLLSDHSGSVVINISSEAGSISSAYGGDYPYAISKTALNMFSKQLGDELRPRGVRVLAVHPGWIQTDMGGDAAPMEAYESAHGILNLLERNTVVAEELFFVNHKGQSMPT